ncbi:MAG: hypothetical protein E7019_00945 [Alphaproteobacteria bacterium]|nr:hypothetical protein [Alphaproteobacteria bacterium]
MVHIIIYTVLVALIICLATGYCRTLRAIQILEKKIAGKVEQIESLRKREKEKSAEIKDLEGRLLKTETDFTNFKRNVSEMKSIEGFQGLH